MDIQVTSDLSVNGAAIAAMSKEAWMQHGREKGIGALNGEEEQSRILEEAWTLSAAAHPELLAQEPEVTEKVKSKGGK